MNVGHHDNISSQINDDESYDNSTIASESFLEEEEMYHRLPQVGGSHKRKRAADSKIDNDHQLYADSLLDYFIICGGDTPASEVSPPCLPAGFQIDRAIDNHNHTALHWAAAMADLEMVKYFLSLGANKRVRNVRGETPIIRAVIFTNNYEKNTMEKMVSLFQTTLQDRDDYGGTVFHHAAALTFSHVKRQGARHYLDILLNMFSEIVSQQEFFHFLNAQDHNGDTALHIVARNNAKKCVRALQGRGVASDISNKNEETVDQILYRSRGHRNQRYDLASSSPVQPEPMPVNGNELSRTSKPIALFPTSSRYETQSAQSFSESFATILPDKGLQVALALENGVHDKEADLAEANRLLRNNIAERDQVRQETLIITQQGFSDYSDVEDDRDSTDEELKLQALNEGLLEQLQHKSLHHEVRAQEQTLPPSVHQPRTQGSLEDRFDDEVVERRLRAAQNLAESQRNRRADAARVVQALSTAGMSERGESYKRLIGSTMGLSPEEVSTMAPELLDVLEMSKLDTTAAQTGDGILVS